MSLYLKINDGVDGKQGEARGPGQEKNYGHGHHKGC